MLNNAGGDLQQCFMPLINAFNKIFNLFLAKIYDEKKRDNDELDFQWREKIDDPVEFQIRLINLYQKGMYEFLRKEVEGISDNDFVFKTEEELQEKKKKWLMFNNVFAIKEVIDSESFDDNHRVLKEVVELLHKYQIRYPRRQSHLSDFFERLLTTGLKQKAGQFFSPPPITRFIVKSLPIKEMINEQLKIAMENLRGDAVFAHYRQLAYKAWSVLNCAIHQVAPSKRVYILSHLDESLDSSHVCQLQDPCHVSKYDEWIQSLHFDLATKHQGFAKKIKRYR